MLVPFRNTSGPKTAKIMFVGEAWGKDEDEVGRPFVGQSGREFARIANEVGLLRNPLPQRYISLKDMCHYWDGSPFLFTNVFAQRPPNNNIDLLCVNKVTAGAGYPMPPLKQGKYVDPKYLPEVERLYAEIDEVKPNLIVALGNTACWAVVHTTKISQIRGTTLLGRGGTKVLPTFHPAAVLRNWALRPVVKADLLKAAREAEFPEIRRPKRQVLVNPTLDEIQWWIENEGRNARIISVDIETGAGQIKCIGFAARTDFSMVVSFIDFRRDGGNFWPTFAEERAAWFLVRDIMRLPAVKLFQNGMYDLQYILKMGIIPHNCDEDTMLLHHAIYPEMQKGLGFLGSIYTDEPAWKLMRNHKEDFKRDE